MSALNLTIDLSLQSANGDISLKLETKPGLFSPQYADAGTLAMLSQVSLKQGDTLLDLGCGYGLVAIWAAKQIGSKNVSMIDVDPEAVELAIKNSQINGLGDINAFCSDGFAKYPITELDWILTNPPFHTDFKVPKIFIEKGFNRLKIGGKLVMVTKRELWYKNKLISVFGGVKIVRIGEYFVFTAERRENTRADRTAKDNLLR